MNDLVRGWQSWIKKTYSKNLSSLKTDEHSSEIMKIFGLSTEDVEGCLQDNINDVTAEIMIVLRKFIELEDE